MYIEYKIVCWPTREGSFNHEPNTKGKRKKDQLWDQTFSSSANNYTVTTAGRDTIVGTDFLHISSGFSLAWRYEGVAFKQEVEINTCQEWLEGLWKTFTSQIISSIQVSCLNFISDEHPCSFPRCHRNMGHTFVVYQIPSKFKVYLFTLSPISWDNSVFSLDFLLVYRVSFHCPVHQNFSILWLCPSLLCSPKLTVMGSLVDGIP